MSSMESTEQSQDKEESPTRNIAPPKDEDSDDKEETQDQFSSVLTLPKIL